MPRDIYVGVNTSAVISRLNYELQHEGRMFSLFSSTEEGQKARSAEESWSTMTELYTSEQPRKLAKDLLGRHRLTRFVDSGVYRHYVDPWDLTNLPATFPRAQHHMANRLRPETTDLATPTRTPRYRDSSSIRPSLRGPLFDAPSTPSAWRPGMSPFRSAADETMSLGVSWSDGLPRGATQR